MSKVKETPTAQERRQVWANAYANAYAQVRWSGLRHTTSEIMDSAESVANMCLIAFDREFGKE